MPKKALTQDQFNERIMQKLGTNYEVVSDYYGKNKPIKIRHLDQHCERKGEPYETLARNPLRGTGCPTCRHVSKKKQPVSYENYKKNFYTNNTHDFKIINYDTIDTPITLEHTSDIDTHQFTIHSAAYAAKGISCKICNQRKLEEVKTKSISEYPLVKPIIEYVESQGYTILTPVSEYPTHLTPEAKHQSILLISENCKHTFSRTLNTLLNYYTNQKTITCNTCDPTVTAYTQESFQALLDEKYPGQYIVHDDFRKLKAHSTITHTPCGHTWRPLMSSVAQHPICPKCGRQRSNNAPKVLKKHSTFEDEVEYLTKGSYYILSQYKSNNRPILMRHNTKYCQHSYWTTPNTFLKGSRCPVCASKRKRNTFLRNKKLRQPKLKERQGDL